MANENERDTLKQSQVCRTYGVVTYGDLEDKQQPPDDRRWMRVEFVDSHEAAKMVSYSHKGKPRYVMSRAQRETIWLN